jgi:tRNA-modifying protein YgfZ
MTSLAYPSIPDNPEALTAAQDGAVLCDLPPFAVLAIDGHDAATFLQGQLSSDILGLSADACEYTSYNSPAGRVLANLLIWRAGPNAADGFRALTSADSATFVAKRLAMFVLRAKVMLTDLSPSTAGFGLGGPLAREAVHAAFGAVPAPFAVVRRGNAVVLGVHGSRYIVAVPVAEARPTFAALERHAQPAGIDLWRWLTIRAGVPVITEATRDKFVPQMINWDVLGGVNFQKGCYTGQEIIARTQYLGRLKERLFAFATRAPAISPGDRLYSPAFGDQPCGIVVNAAPAPQGGHELLAVLQLAAAAEGNVHLGTPDGPALTAMALPYAIPERPAPRGRIA